MKRTALVLAYALAIAGTAHANPIAEFFAYSGDPRPVAGDCAAIAAEQGTDATWFGTFAGNRRDPFTETYAPVSLRGCFRSEDACRIWQQRAISYLDAGTLLTMSCRLGRR